MIYGPESEDLIKAEITHKETDMGESVIYAGIDVVIFGIKIILRFLSFGIMFAKDGKDNLTKEFGFAKRADKASFAKNFTTKTGTKEVNRFKEGVSF